MPEPEPFFGGGGLVVVVVGVVLDEVVTGVVEVVVVGRQEALTPLIGPTPAGTIDEAGVPGGTSTVKLWVWPVSSVTVTVHSSAEATGIQAIPITINTVATVAAAVFSLRLVDTLTCLLPACTARRSATVHPN